MTKEQDVRYRAAAARCMLDAMAGRNEDENDDRELAAFLSVFHPEMGAKEIRDVVRQNRREKDQERAEEMRKRREQ